MGKRKPLESRAPAIPDIKLVPAVARLPAAVPAERRDVAARHALLCRIHGEFEEMPGLSLTLGQAAKLFGLPPDIASRILERLTDARVLRQKGDGQFALYVEKS
jgi:DNA-binding IclR family transcriptional regulator